MRCIHLIPFFFLAWLFLFDFLTKVIWEQWPDHIYLVLNLFQSSFGVIVCFTAVILASIIFHFKANFLSHYLVDASHQGSTCSKLLGCTIFCFSTISYFLSH